jgi:hypothetical protein
VRQGPAARRGDAHYAPTPVGRYSWTNRWTTEDGSSTICCSGPLPIKNRR